MSLQLSTIGIAILGLIYFSVGIALFAAWRHLPLGRGKRLGIAGIAAAVTVVLTTWDVVLVSWGVNRHCPTAGIEVKRQVVAEGYYDDCGAWNEDILRRSGFRYIEYRDVSFLKPAEKHDVWRMEAWFVIALPWIDRLWLRSFDPFRMSCPSPPQCGLEEKTILSKGQEKATAVAGMEPAGSARFSVREAASLARAGTLRSVDSDAEPAVLQLAGSILRGYLARPTAMESALSLFGTSR